jgi:hypothetical protein
MRCRHQEADASVTEGTSCRVEDLEPSPVRVRVFARVFSLLPLLVRRVRPRLRADWRRWSPGSGLLRWSRLAPMLPFSLSTLNRRGPPRWRPPMENAYEEAADRRRRRTRPARFPAHGRTRGGAMSSLPSTTTAIRSATRSGSTTASGRPSAGPGGRASSTRAYTNTASVMGTTG